MTKIKNIQKYVILNPNYETENIFRAVNHPFNLGCITSQCDWFGLN